MDEKLKELEGLFRESLADKILSRAERKSLREKVKQLALSKQEESLALHGIYKTALEKVDKAGSQTLMDWFYEAAKTLNAGEAENHESRAYFSPGETCRDAIISAIKAARQNIDICVFTISDNEITDAIIVAHKLNKMVRIVTDNDKALDRGSDIHRLIELGLSVRFGPNKAHMHHKFAIVDERIITGSYNWTRSAADYNYENIIISADPDLHAQFEREFEKLWEKFG